MLRIIRIPQTHPGDGVNRSKFTISENGHVAYQIKGFHEMQKHGRKYFCPPPTSPQDPLGCAKR